MPNRTPTTRTDAAPSGPPPTAAPALALTLAGGVVAGPLYVVTWLGQATVRDGFDPTRHSASLLSNGPGGWVQVANFLVCGLLTVAAGVGLVRAGAGRRGVGRGVSLYGLGLVAAGLFHADPVEGFPPGSAAGTVSWHGLLHLAAGSIGFVGLVTAMLLAARRWARRGQPRRAAGSLVVGVVYLAAFVGIASGGGGRVTVVAFSVAVVAGWAWLSVVAAGAWGDLRQGEGAAGEAP